MQDAKEEVRSRLAIEDVIGEYVQLKRAGRNFKGLSPFSGEKTPSFFVSPDKNIWHDFSSNRGGDIFGFVMEVEGMDFRAALEHLARKAGVDLSQYESQNSRDLAGRKKRLLEANRLAVQYYQHSMMSNKKAIDYVFKQRGLNKKVVQDFQIGYAPDSGDALKNYLTRKGFDAKELSAAGLTNRYGGDLFRSRMMIPLSDASGQTVGFTGRIIGDIEGAPKYLNTPQTLLYDKGRQVFGFSQAKPAIRSENFVVIVEGNLDVVSSHQVDVGQVVAAAGTALTENHLRALKRLTSDVRLAFDNDPAGVAATERAITIASELGIELSIINLPEQYKDPDELIKADPGAWAQSIKDQTEPAVDWVLTQHQARVDLATAAGKRAFTTTALAVIRGLSDPVEREHYERKVAELTNSTLEAVRAKLIQDEPEKKRLKQVQSSGEVRLEAYLHQDNALAVACVDASSQELFAHIDPLLFVGDERRAMARYLATHHGKILTDTPKDLHDFDTYVKILLLKAETRYADWSENDRYFETARLLRQVENEHKKQTRDELTNQLRDAEATGDEPKAEKLRVELNQLIKEIARGR